MCGLARLYEVLDYNPMSGVFTWKISPGNGINAGDIAGSLETNGYIRIGIDGERYLAHRLAWFYYYHKWPVGQIDHKFGNKTDNRIAFLREATPSMNQQNVTKPSSNSTTGYLGVTYYKDRNKFHAQIEIDGKTKHLGFYNTPQEAHIMYLKVKGELHSVCLEMIGGVSFAA